MNTQNDGGQAFAQYRTDPWGNPIIENGMTLRDYFAAKALPSLISMPVFQDAVELINEQHELDALKNAMAANAYSWADAMLAERAK